MVRRPKPAFGPDQQQRLLDILGEARRELIHAGEAMGRGSLARGAAETLRQNIDDLARHLTGDPTYFHLRAHSAPRGDR